MLIKIQLSGKTNSSITSEEVLFNKFVLMSLVQAVNVLHYFKRFRQNNNIIGKI